MVQITLDFHQHPERHTSNPAHPSPSSTSSAVQQHRSSSGEVVHVRHLAQQTGGLDKPLSPPPGARPSRFQAETELLQRATEKACKDIHPAVLSWGSGGQAVTGERHQTTARLCPAEPPQNPAGTEGLGLSPPSTATALQERTSAFNWRRGTSNNSSRCCHLMRVGT